MFTFTASAQYGILSAVQLNEGAEDQYLALEAFFLDLYMILQLKKV
jgi:hypothetical protein